MTTLYTFNCPVDSSNCPDGAQINDPLVQGLDGNFYGATLLGGANYSGVLSDQGGGTVFKVTPGGAFTTLYNFCSQSDCTDGYLPSAPVEARDGNFYGVTYYGGVYGGGTVYRISSVGTFATIYNFCSQDACTDGGGP